MIPWFVQTNDENRPETERICTIMSTGAILLADILPSLFVKAISPFLSFYVKYVFSKRNSPFLVGFHHLNNNFLFDCSVRVFLACFLQCVGFLLVALADSNFMAISGVVLTSLSSGLGEVTFLAYSSGFHKWVFALFKLKHQNQSNKILILPKKYRIVETSYRVGHRERVVLAFLAVFRMRLWLQCFRL